VLAVDSINSTCTYYNTVNKRIPITAYKRIHIISAYFLAAASDKRMRLLTSLYGSYTSFAVFLAKHVGKHSSGTFYVAFQDPGQILIIWDCPGDSGTVGAYVQLKLKMTD